MSYISQRGATGGLALTANGIFQQYTPLSGLPSGYTDNTFFDLLGSRWDLEDGREVRLALAGAVALATGKLMQAPVIVANHQNLVVTAVQAYSNNGNVPATVTVTLGGTAATINQYQLGYAIVVDGTGKGQTLQIAGNPAQATTTGSLVVTLADGPNTALDTTSIVSLIPNPCNGIVINVNGTLQQAVGVTLYPVTAGNYAYILTKGIVACLNDGALTTGSAVSPSNAVDGAVENGVIAQGFVGTAIYTGVDTKYNPILLNI